MGYKGKLSTNKTRRKKNFFKKRFHKKSPKDRINGVHRKATKKHEETSSLDKKIISTKIYPKDRINDSTQER